MGRTKSVIAALALLSVVALSPAPSQAENADPVVSRVCWYRNYCEIYGPPYVQQCRQPVTAIYCEETRQSGLMHWWWQ